MGKFQQLIALHYMKPTAYQFKKPLYNGDINSRYAYQKGYVYGKEGRYGYNQTWEYQKDEVDIDNYFSWSIEDELREINQILINT